MQAMTPGWSAAAPAPTVPDTGIASLLALDDLIELDRHIARIIPACFAGTTAAAIVFRHETGADAGRPETLLDAQQRHRLEAAQGAWHVDALTIGADGSGCWLVRVGIPIDTEDAGWRMFVELLSACASRLLEIEYLRLEVKRTDRARHIQRALFAIATMASSDLDMPEMLHGIHEVIAELMYAENFFITLYMPESDSLRFLYIRDSVDTTPTSLEVDLPVSSIPDSLTVAMIRSGESQMGPSVEIRRRFGLGFNPQLGPESEDWLGVPMSGSGDIRGAIVVQSYLPDVRYTEEDRALLQYVAQHVLTALERKQARDELELRVEQRTRELAEANRVLQHEISERERGVRVQSALFRIAERASTADSLDEFYAAVHGIVGGLLNARNFYIALLSDDGESLDVPYSVDEIDPVRPSRRLGTGVTEYVLRTGRALLADRASIEELTAEGAIATYGPRAYSWLGVPLICNERTVGVLAVQSYDDASHFSAADQELLTFVAYHIANSLERKLAQDSLRVAYVELEGRVEERTRELGRANRDLTRQIGERERIEARLMHQALHDTLTGLPNRALLLERLDQALSRYRADPAQVFSVLFLDLDRFKVVNDSVGHLIGDELLKQVAQRLASACGDALVARLGGDEFAVLVEQHADVAHAASVAQNLLDALVEPVRVGDKEMFTSASIGIAHVEPHYQRAEELLRDADAAMYRAKAQGRQRHEIFDEKLRMEALRALDLEGQLRRAIARNEFEPHFQSIVSLSDARAVGFEALLRWNHPERGILLPEDFLGAAEDNGCIEQIDWLMFTQACEQAQRLPDHTYVSINVSASHLRSPGFEESLLHVLSRSGLSPDRLRLEITEGALLDEPEQTRRVLLRLRHAGILVQLDDFGTGYSSLSYLHQLPIHALKIDRSFVADLSTRGSSMAVIRAIIALTESLGIEVIAEGVETPEQRKSLIELGCRMGQGYLFSMPAPVARINA